MKHGSPFSCQLHHIAFDRLKSHTQLSCPGTQSINIPLKFHCVFFVLNFTIANTVISKVLFQTQYLMRCHLCTERTKKDQEQCPWGRPTKPEPNQILLHLQQLVVVWSPVSWENINKCNFPAKKDTTVNPLYNVGVGPRWFMTLKWICRCNDFMFFCPQDE